MEGFKNCIYSLVPRLFSQLASTREKIGKENEKKKKKKKNRIHSSFFRFENCHGVEDTEDTWHLATATQLSNTW